MSSLAPVVWAKLLHGDEATISLFINQIQTNGWCKVRLPSSIKIDDDTIQAFFAQQLNEKRKHENAANNIGYMKSSTDERVRVLSGSLYQNNTTIEIKHVNVLQRRLNEFGLELFKNLCKHIIKQHWVKIASQNEICLARNYFYHYKRSEYIISFWMGHSFVCHEIVLLISMYFGFEEMESFNYAMFEAIKYKRPLPNSNSKKESFSLSVKEHHDIGFCAMGIGQTKSGLQLFDRTKNEYIDVHYEKDQKEVYVWVGLTLHELSQKKIPLGLHRVKYKQNRISYLYEISVGEQIPSISFANYSNLVHSHGADHPVLRSANRQFD